MITRTPRHLCRDVFSKRGMLLAEALRILCLEALAQAGQHHVEALLRPTMSHPNDVHVRLKRCCTRLGRTLPSGATCNLAPKSSRPWKQRRRPRRVGLGGGVWSTERCCTENGREHGEGG